MRLLYIIFIMFFINYANAETVNFGYIPDSDPISPHNPNRSNNPTLQGTCESLYKHLEKSGYNIKLIEMPYKDRFLRFKNNSTVSRWDSGIECSASTINNERISCLWGYQACNKEGVEHINYLGRFSDSFDVAFLAVIAKTSTFEKIKNKEKIKVGILSTGRIHPVTTERISGIISASIQYYENREDVRIALINDEIEAFASDDTLLQALMYYKGGDSNIFDQYEDDEYKKTLASKGFEVYKIDNVPESYGVVIYRKTENDDKLYNDVNEWVNKSASAAKDKIDRKIEEHKEKLKKIFDQKEKEKKYNEFMELAVVMLFASLIVILIILFGDFIGLFFSRFFSKIKKISKYFSVFLYKFLEKSGDVSGEEITKETMENVSSILGRKKPED